MRKALYNDGLVARVAAVIRSRTLNHEQVLAHVLNDAPPARLLLAVLIVIWKPPSGCTGSYSTRSMIWKATSATPDTNVRLHP